MPATRARDYGQMPTNLARPRVRPANPSKPASDGTCFFFRLPGELRNRIYEFSLTEYPKCLTYIETGGKGQLSIDNKRKWQRSKNGKGRERAKSFCEANQLQYVNKQIRKETKGLGVQFNGINFHTRKKQERSPITTCVTFVEQMPVQWCKFLRQVNIRRLEADAHLGGRDAITAKCYDFTGRNRLLQICKSNPQMLVRWAHPRWDLDFSWCFFLTRGIELSVGFRGKDESGLFPVYDLEHFKRDADFIRGGKTTEELMEVLNFKIFPSDFGIPEEDLLARIEEANNHCSHHMLNEGGEKEVTAKALEWYFEGI